MDHGMAKDTSPMETMNRSTSAASQDKSKLDNQVKICVWICVCVSGYRIGGGDMVNDAMPIARLLPPTITRQYNCP